MATFTGYSSASDGSIYAGDGTYSTARGFLYFDTSSLAGATISAATLSVYATSVTAKFSIIWYIPQT